MSKLTSSEANKLLRSLKEKKQDLIAMEKQSSTFVASLGEDPETVRPEYDFTKVQKELEDIEVEIRKVKHALNVFNSSTVVPGFGMTIDEMLIYIPQLSEKKLKLMGMARKLPKQRVVSMQKGNIIDYTYANYDINEAKVALAKVSDELAKAQTALDIVNNTESFEV